MEKFKVNEIVYWWIGKQEKVKIVSIQGANSCIVSRIEKNSGLCYLAYFNELQKIT